VLRRVGFLFVACLIGLLAACGTSPVIPKIPSKAASDVAGVWNDYLWLAELCGSEFALGVKLELEQTGLTVTGQTQLLGTDNAENPVTVPGSFTGSVTEDGVLTGVAIYQDAYSYASFDIRVTHEAEMMRGTRDRS
jgi:hypothetical protein